MAAPGAITYNSPLTGFSLAMFCTTAGNALMEITNAQLVAGCVAGGPLADFFALPFANAAAADTAFRNRLGEIVIRQVSGTASTSVAVVTWVAAGPATLPALAITAVASTDSAYEILIRVSHSIIR